MIRAVPLKNLDKFSASTASLSSTPKIETIGNDMIALTDIVLTDINKDAIFLILLLNY